MRSAVFSGVLLLFAVFLIPAAGPPAQAVERTGSESGPVTETGPAVGADIPHDLTARDQYGTMQNFESVRGPRGAVLVFVRSADWCPFCQQQLIELGERGREIETFGYEIVTISYDPVEKLKAFTDKYEFTHTMLSDPDSEIISAFGIFNDTVSPSSDYYGIPHPAVFVVNARGVIQAKLMEESYKKRPTIEEILDSLVKTEHL